MDRAAPGSGAGSLPLLLALALGKWSAGRRSPRRKVGGGVAGSGGEREPAPRARLGPQGALGAVGAQAELSDPWAGARCRFRLLAPRAAPVGAARGRAGSRGSAAGAGARE